MVRNGNPWIVAKIKERLGQVHYHVEVGTEVWKRHVDQITDIQGEPNTDCNIKRNGER